MILNLALFYYTIVARAARRQIARAERTSCRGEPSMTFRTLVGLAIGLIIIGMIATAATIWAWRRDTTSAAVRDISNIATVLAEQTSRSVQSMDLVLSDLIDKLQAMGATSPDSFRRVAESKDVYNILVDRLQHLSQATVTHPDRQHR